MVSLRALECLVAVADSGSITGAAAVLHASQPAVSHQLASLERETRTTLLRRGPRGVTLTPAGRAALPHARRAVDAASFAASSARAVEDSSGGTLRLVAVQSLTVPIMAPTILHWHRRHPDVNISLRESTSAEELRDLLENDEVDIAVMPATVTHGFVATPLTDEEVVVTAATSHALAPRTSVRLEDLDGLPLVHFAVHNGLSSWLDEAFAAAGVRPQVAMRTSVTAAAPQLAAAGLGVAVSPVSAVSTGFAGIVRSFSPRWTRQLVAVTPSTPDPLAARFIGDLRRRGVHIPSAVKAQLSDEDPSSEARLPSLGGSARLP
jgi:DNA-binding transcriptional LysR family regulator